MPYEGEFGSKTAHIDIIQNPEIQSFLEECTYLTPPSEDECQALVARFKPVPQVDTKLPSFVLAVDGSSYEASIDDQIPSTKIGYLKIGAVLISLSEYDSLREGNFVDPFKVAELQDNASALTFIVPSANIRWGKNTSVRDSFRAWVDAQFFGNRTRFKETDYKTSLRSTLFHLAALRPGELGTDDPSRLMIYKCPNCEKGPIELLDTPDQQHCPFCDREVYPTDALRIWEEVHEYQSNGTAISRLMSVLEHLIPIHYIRFIFKHTPLVLSGMSFFIDGPLAIYGTPAWLHRSIMIFLSEVNSKLLKLKQLPLLAVGLQKSGQVIDHVNFIDRFLPNNRLFAIDDAYRYKYILPGRAESSQGFGFETYYGQDFIYKTPTGRTFVFALPYPYASKEYAGTDFSKEKVRLTNYPHLPKAIGLINKLESDLYKNAVVPIALAHSYTAISFEPGGKVLDLLTRRALRT